MDQDQQQRIDEAKAAGYSDEEIAKALGTAPPPAQATMPNGHTVPILSAEEKAQFNQSEQQVSDRNTGEQVTTGLGVAGKVAAGVGIPYAAYKVGKAVLSPAKEGIQKFAEQGMQTANRAVGAMEGRTAVDAAREARMAGGGAYGRPVAPTPMPGVSTAGPVAPANMAAANEAVMNKAAPSMANRVQAAAAQRISNLPAMGEMLGGAARLAGRALGPLSAVMQTTDTGPAVPSTGRMRGMEINPLTGRPWTPQQIAQYESNPQVFDAQMAQPQMRR